MKLIKVLKSKSGASMILVICMALLLFTIGTSVLVASAASTSATLMQRNYNQMEIYNDSVLKTFTKSLQEGVNEVTNVAPLNKADAKTLGNQLVFAMYESKNNNPNTDYGDLPNDIVLGGITPPENMDVEITLLFDNPMVQITKENPEDIANGIARQEKESTVSTFMTATIEVTYKEKVFKTFATYEYTSGHLKDNGNPANMQITDAGNWRLINSAKTQNI